MTNKERLISMLGFMADGNSINGALIDANLDGTATYTSENLAAIRLCAIEIIELLLTTPDQKNDVALDIKYDRKAVMERLNLLKVDAGLIVDTLVQPKIRNKSFVW